MANKTITMNKIRQIIRLHTQAKGSKWISKHTGVSRNTVKKYIYTFTHRIELKGESLRKRNLKESEITNEE